MNGRYVGLGLRVGPEAVRGNNEGQSAYPGIQPVQAKLVDVIRIRRRVPVCLR